jgi:hypothetical protein
MLGIPTPQAFMAFTDILLIVSVFVILIACCVPPLPTKTFSGVEEMPHKKCPDT